jgi:hypothetical protein
VFPRDMVCFRNVSVDTLHKGDTEDDDDNNNNNNNNNIEDKWLLEYFVPCLITWVVLPKFHRKLCIVFALTKEAAGSIETLVLFYKTPTRLLSVIETSHFKCFYLSMISCNDFAGCSNSRLRLILWW